MADISRIGLGARFAAAWVDWLIAFVAIAVGVDAWWIGKYEASLHLARQLMNDDGAMDLEYAGLMTLAMQIFTVFPAVYGAILTSSLGGGQTLGMRMVGIRVVDGSGRPPGLARAAIRSLLWLVSLIPLGVVLLWMGVDSEKRGVHDRLTGTSVVDARA